jgi:hypothetical protein
MLGRAICLLLCSAVITACGSSVNSSDEASATNAGLTLSTESEPCFPRGTGLVSVVALPERKPLSKTSDTEVELRKEFAFAVTVANHGCAPERDLTVSAGVAAEPAFTGKAQIDEIVPGEQATVLIGHLPLPPLEERLHLRVEVEPVPTEARLENNAVEYPVRFVLG